MSLLHLIENTPKAELHVHIEGTLEPELMLKLAQRNNITLPYASVEEVRQKYKFNNLQSFLNIYYEGTQVLLTDKDFYDLTMAYIKKAIKDNDIHAEIFFDPQTHTSRGVSFNTVISGITAALNDTKHEHNQMSFKLIMCFLKNLGADEAMKTLLDAKPYLQFIDGIGLDSMELGYPPKLFKEVFKKAQNMGLHLVCHAGEKGPPKYIWQALDIGAERIDHGIRCLEDHKLVEHLVKNNIPLTVCPLSNVELGVFKNLKDHNLKKMLDLGLCVTVNSDDPAYFGGYVNENFIQITKALSLSEIDIKKLIDNSFQASF